MAYPNPAECNFIARLLGRKIGKQIVKDFNTKNKQLTEEWQGLREKVKKETQELLKEKIKSGKIKNKKDLEYVARFIRGRLPKGTKKNNGYRNITEQVGYDLIDKRLTIVDYEEIQRCIKILFASLQEYNRIMKKFNPYSLPGLPLPFPGGLTI